MEMEPLCPHFQYKINEDISNIDRLAARWMVNFAPHKTKSMTISTKKDANLNQDITFGNARINETTNHQHLGITFCNNLSWKTHIENIEKKARKKLNMMMPLKYKLDRKSLETIINPLFYPLCSMQ